MQETMQDRAPAVPGEGTTTHGPSTHGHVHTADCGHDHGHDHDHHHHHAPVETFVRGAPKVGRNDPCPCGSGKKHKKCCLGA